MNRYKWTPMFPSWVRWRDCLKTRARRHNGERVTVAITIYISNGDSSSIMCPYTTDSVLGDRLFVRFIVILAVLKIFPFCVTYYKVCSVKYIMVNTCVVHDKYIMVNTCVVHDCAVGTAKQNVTLHEIPKDRSWRS